MKRSILLLVVCLHAAQANARDELGRLATIIAPNNGRPAVLRAGDTFASCLRANVMLRIESASGAADLEMVSAQRFRGLWQVIWRVPDQTPAGAYTLITVGPGPEDRIHRSVYVIDNDLESYTIARVNNVRVGDLRGTDAALFRITAAINDRQPALVILSGDLTASGAPDQFRIAMDILNDCTAPTFVATGDADDREGLVESYLGPVPAALPFGQDAYLLCPGVDGFTPGNQAKLHIERRAYRSARWSIGLAGLFPRDDLRAELTLFVDDPLDYLFEENDETQADSRARWGRVKPLSVSPGRAQIHWYTVGPRGIEPIED